MIDLPAGTFTVDLPVALGSGALRDAILRGVRGRDLGAPPVVVRVVDVEVRTDGGDLVVGVALEGPYTGWAYLRGAPYLLAEGGQVQLRDPIVTFAKRSLALRAAAKVLRGAIERVVNLQLRRASAGAMERAGAEASKLLAGAGAPRGVGVNGRLGALELTSIAVTDSGLRIGVSARGSLAIQVERLPEET